MPELIDKLIVALDVDSLEKAEHFVGVLYPTVKFFKVGSQLFTACGPEAVKMIGNKGAQAFLDLKFYDIPNTVGKVVSAGTGLSCEMIAINTDVGQESRMHWPVFMMTVHIDLEGGREMLEKAVNGAKGKARELNRDKPYIVGVTVLTSSNNEANTSRIVLGKAKLAQKAGLDGVVCSVYEAAAVRKECGEEFIIVTPGIRPKGYPADDQKRTATAAEAIASGADYIVVGRPILEAKDPLKAVSELL